MRRILISLNVIGLLFIPQFAAGDDLADLKAANEKIIKAYNTHDAETIASMISPGAVSFDYDAAFPNVAPMENTQAQITQSMTLLFGAVEFISINPYNPQYRVIGNTGIVWGHYTVNIKLKGQPSYITRYARYTSTWIKSGGNWMALTTHASAIPASH